MNDARMAKIKEGDEGGVWSLREKKAEERDQNPIPKLPV